MAGFADGPEDASQSGSATLPRSGGATRGKRFWPDWKRLKWISSEDRSEDGSLLPRVDVGATMTRMKTVIRDVGQTVGRRFDGGTRESWRPSRTERGRERVADRGGEGVELAGR